MNPGDNALIPFLRDALEIVRISIDLAWEKHPAFYRVAATQLRLLLCDTTRRHGRIVDISLASRVFPALSLRPLAGESFDLGAPRIPLRSWLDQIIPDKDLQTSMSIRDLIREVCDNDGGAHVDLKGKYGVPRRTAQRDWILRIASLVFAELQLKLRELDPSHGDDPQVEKTTG